MGIAGVESGCPALGSVLRSNSWDEDGHDVYHDDFVDATDESTGDCMAEKGGYS